VLILLAPALPNLPSFSTLSSLSFVKQLATRIPITAEQKNPKDAQAAWPPLLEDSVITTLLSPHLPSSDGQIDLPELDNVAEQKLPLEENNEQKTSLLALQQAIILEPQQYLDIEEPNDELVSTLSPLQKDNNLEPAERKVEEVATPVARPAAEPMDPEFVSFDGLRNPPIQTPQMKLHRRFAKVQKEVERIKIMLDELGITPDSEPEQWDPALAAAEEHVPALYLYRDSWRELLNMLPLQAPLRYYYVTSPYGMRTNKKTGVTRFHHGVDLAGTWKAKLRPPASGIVTFAGRDGGFGKVVRVQHAHGIETVYAHLSSVLVSKGSFVTTQDILGTMGNTGHSDGMHLHYEIRIDGKSKDPEDFFTYGHKLTVTGALSGEM
ncbi:MAG: M23 family metallopeptidase, partial [Pseudomonadota bacterium]|nr:M23 family metallopeptidase [Pseudomonadota bacterium]